jgi:hypothetical protein
MADWSNQLYWEDVNVGDSVPPTTLNLTVHRLVVFAGGNRDFAPIHHDTEVSHAQGAPDMYANNVFCQAMWERTVREWIGLDGRIRKVGPFRMRIFNTVGEAVRTDGQVKRKWQEDGVSFVEVEMVSTHSRGVSIGPGPVVVTLPTRA